MEHYRIGIVGLGPRGLSALENLFLELCHQGSHDLPKLLLFECADNFGCGQVYNLSQPDTNWMNVPQRLLHIEGRREIRLNDLVIPSFPSYHEWCEYSTNYHGMCAIDKYPSRRHIGVYLNQRYRSISTVLKTGGILSEITSRVNRVKWIHGSFELETENDNTYGVDETVLTIGHQPTELSQAAKTVDGIFPKL